MSRPRILFIDAYDSFANNIISLVETQLDVDVTTIQIDSHIDNLRTFVSAFDAVVVGPGPGSPENPQDIGIISSLWHISTEHIRPVLGICLGFQSLVCAFGGGMKRLAYPRHGISTRVDTCGQGLFENLASFETIQYHSLRAELRQSGLSSQGCESCPDLVPLAWDYSDASYEPILMGVQHKTKPFWGIQFHPESICSSIEAKSIMRNWWTLCKEWNCAQGVERRRQSSTELGFLKSNEYETVDNEDDLSMSSVSATPSSASSMSSATSFIATRESSPIEDYNHIAIPLADLNVPKIVQRLELQNQELVVLDSEQRLMSDLGRYSIIGPVDENTPKLSYRAGSATIAITTAGQTVFEKVDSVKGVLAYFKKYLLEHNVDSGCQDIPFWGGLIGYITYEGCLETIGIHSPAQFDRDDLCFVFIERSIVVDHVNGIVHVQSIRPGDEDGKWVQDVQSKLLESSKSAAARSLFPRVFNPRLPNKTNYISKIVNCQEEIRAGNSYELCLTNQAIFKTPKSVLSTSWQKYQTLRTLNPAPFASYLRLGTATILSTSPERFMKWTRPTLDKQRRTRSVCQFRPIKGTVQKRQVLPDGTHRIVSLQEATQVLSTPKETAENLMIVDLIRHDLHGVAGSGNVSIPSLMQVEEYATVYQLVSVIEGTLLSSPGHFDETTGIDVLASSLPPGSMTGAPKKRACELLQEIEDERRSIYSGVIGYMCVGGGGDFSVVIRTVFKWADEEDEEGNEAWRIGAGGAITALSDTHDEWEEMCGKLSSTRRLFE